MCDKGQGESEHSGQSERGCLHCGSSSMENFVSRMAKSDDESEGIRQGSPWDHLSAISTHAKYLISALLGAKAAALPEEEEEYELLERQVPPGMLVPTGPLKERWDGLIMVLILYSAASVPMRVCFDAQAEGIVWAFEATMSVVFMIDVALAFNTAYQEDGLWVYDRGRIARNYLLGWFWIDCPSALPVELIEVVMERSDMLVAQADGLHMENLATLRFLRMFRLFRLLRLLKMKEYVSRLEEALMVNLRILKLVEIFVKLGCAHRASCAQRASCERAGGGGWVGEGFPGTRARGGDMEGDLCGWWDVGMLLITL